MLETISDAFECLLWLCEEKETLSKNEKEKKEKIEGERLELKERVKEIGREGGMEVYDSKVEKSEK